MSSKSSTSVDSRARVYGLANPGVLFQEREAIGKAVFAALRIAPSNAHRFTLSESSGWLDFTAVEELWDRKAPPVLPQASAALRAAEAALVALAQFCSSANKQWPDALRDIALFPPTGLLRRAQMSVVPRPDGSAWDHWLYRAEPQLYVDGGATIRAGVRGSQIEVRVGHAGQIIGVCTRWQPLSRERWYTELSTLTPADDSQPAPHLGFLLSGEGIPQYYLSPYYFIFGDQDYRSVSASPWSLTVDVGRIDQRTSRMRLLALAEGGSGDYAYNWAVHSYGTPDRGFREMGSGFRRLVNTASRPNVVGSTIDLDNGEYVVLLNVKDRKTGAFKHHQQQVFSSPFIPSESDAFRNA